MPYFARNVSLDYAFANGLHNTGIVEVASFGGQPYVTDWQGSGAPAPVPVPASGILLIAGIGALIGRGAIRKRTAFPV